MTPRQRRYRDEYRRTPKRIGVLGWCYVEKAGLSIYCERPGLDTRIGIIPWRIIRAALTAKL